MRGQKEFSLMKTKLALSSSTQTRSVGCGFSLACSNLSTKLSWRT